MESNDQRKNKKKYKTRLFQDFILSKDDRIGTGGFGEVYKAQKRQDKQHYAIKIVRIGNKKEANSIQREVLNLAKLDHPNIVRYYTSWIDTATAVPPKLHNEILSSEQNFFYLSDEIESLQTDGYFSPSSNSSNGICNDEDDNDTDINYLCIQMELCENSLEALIMDNENRLSSAVLTEYAVQICKGLKHIHDKGIIHRDLKPDNIFISFNKSIKIGDLGLSRCTYNVDNRLLQEKMSLTACGTKMYKAPEIQTKKYNERVDLYSLGVIYLKMCCQTKTNSEFIEIFQTCCKCKMSDLRQLGISSPFRELIPNLLSDDPNKRPTCKQILSKHLQRPIDPNALQRVMRYSDPKKRQLQTKNFVLNTLGEIDLIKCEKYNLVLQTASTIFELHGGKHIPMSIFTPLGRSNKNSVKVFYSGDYPVGVTRDSRITFAQYVTKENLTSIRRYSIGNIFKNNEEFIPKQMQECAFDVVEKHLHHDSNTEAEILFTAKQIIDTLGIKANMIYHINDHLLLDSILENFYLLDKNLDKRGIYKLLMTVSQNNLSVENFKLRLESNKCPPNVLITIVSLYTPQTLKQLKEVLKRNKFVDSIRNCQYLERLIINLKLFGIKTENIYIAPLLLSPRLKFCGLNFKIYLEKEELGRQDIAFGGRYESFVYNKTKDCFAMGISFNVEHISQYVNEIKLFSDGCRITCRNENNKSKIIPILKLLWSHEITAYEYTDCNKGITNIGITIELSGTHRLHVTVFLKDSTEEKVIYTGSYTSELFLKTIKAHIQAIQALKLIN